MGIPVRLGTDDYYHDMLQLLRENVAGSRTRTGADGGVAEILAGSTRTIRPTYYELLELATRRGAEVMRIDEGGSLEPGKKPDIILVDLLNPFLTPTKDPLTSLMLYDTSSDVDTVIVDGRILKRDGALTILTWGRPSSTPRGGWRRS